MMKHLYWAAEIGLGNMNFRNRIKKAPDFVVPILLFASLFSSFIENDDILAYILEDAAVNTCKSVIPSDFYETENVIILVIDGVRNEEAFDDPTHQYIPHIWNDLRPDGTIYTDMYITNRTATTQGHFSITTGTRSIVPLTFGTRSNNSREHRPSFFEVYRKTFDLPRSETWIISGKSQLSTCDYSLHPMWGEEFCASMEYHAGNNDHATMERLYEVVTMDSPSLVLINLKDVDEKGHFEAYEDYVNAIMIADSLVYDLWQNIQSDTHYKDKTTLFITTDHGRGLDVRTHGGTDHYNRHVMFLALGPDIKKGVEITSLCDLNDLASTTAELLGFDMPYSEGRVLYEMLEQYATSNIFVPQHQMLEGENRLSNSEEASLYPSIDANTGDIHVVWSERSAADEEQRIILLRSSSDFGETWSESETVVDDFRYYNRNYPSDITGSIGFWDGENGFETDKDVVLERTGTPLYANIKSSSDSNLIVAVNGYSVLSFPVRKELLWGVNIFLKNPGEEWIEQGFDNSEHIVANTPSLAVNDQDAWCSWTDGRAYLSVGKVEEGENILDRSFRLPDAREYDYHYRATSLAMHDEFLHLAFEFNKKNMGKIIYMKVATSDLKLDTVRRLDFGRFPSFDPRIACSGEGIYAVWADYSDHVWQIMFRRSNDQGATFGDIQQISSSSTGAWHPDIAIDGDTVVVVWEDYRDDNGEIYFIGSQDDGLTWSPETRLTAADAFSINPRVTSYKGEFYCVWQDYRDANWEIYFRKLE
jgi:hypothetical protein